jgi:hypothetical protein
VLYHLPESEIDASLAELARVLAPGGHLIATTGSNNDHGRNQCWAELFRDRL